VSRRISAGSGVSTLSNENTSLVEGGRPRGRTFYFPRTEREKLIVVLALTLLVAARMPRRAVLPEAPDLLLDFELRLEAISHSVTQPASCPQQTCRIRRISELASFAGREATVVPAVLGQPLVSIGLEKQITWD
jgi:hypothetical protein